MKVDCKNWHIVTVVTLFHDGFLGTLTGVVCHYLPLVLPAVPVRSPLILERLPTVRTTRRSTLVQRSRSGPNLRSRSSIGLPPYFTPMGDLLNLCDIPLV